MHKEPRLTFVLKVKGQRRVIIWSILVVLESIMLYIKFQQPQPVDFKEKMFFKRFSVYRHGGHLGHMTRII